MPEIILNCPQCERALRVPENLMGQLVKCPACGLTFSVPASTEPQPVPPAPREPQTPVSDRHSAPEHYPSAEEEFEQRPRRLSPGQDERERARSFVMPPAILLLLTGILGLLADVLQVVYASVMTRFPPPAPAQPPQDVLEAIRQGATGPVPIILGAVFAVVSILIILAAVQMLRLRTYEFAMAGTVLAMLNFVNCCCVAGLPVGIWALVMLSKPEVISAFRMRPPPPAEEPIP